MITSTIMTQSTAYMANNKKTLHFPELDLFRGLAALFMIINHIGFALWSKSEISSDIPTFILLITSFAPVLFFFASGLGAGIQSHATHKKFNLLSTLYKFCLLMIADLFFAFGQGKLLGFDFLGFIAVIVLILEPIKYNAYARWICIAGIAAVFTLRFLIAPELNLDSSSFTSTIMNWIAGNKVDNCSYPFSPWMTYPLLGFLVGSVVAEKKLPIVFINQYSTQILLLSATLVSSAVSIFFYFKSVSFFRWGAVGFGFYVMSFAVIGAAILLVLLGNRIKNKLSLLYIGGAASLAIVPVHYFVIHLLKEFGLENLYTLSFSITSSLALIISFLSVKNIEKIFKKSQGFLNNQNAVIVVMVLILVLAFSTYHFSASLVWVSKISQLLGQLLICLLFILRIKKASYK